MSEFGTGDFRPGSRIGVWTQCGRMQQKPWRHFKMLVHEPHIPFNAKMCLLKRLLKAYASPNQFVRSCCRHSSSFETTLMVVLPQDSLPFVLDLWPWKIPFCIDDWVWVKCTYFPQGTPSLDVCFRKERNPRFKTQWAENRTCWGRCQVKKRSCYSLLGMNWFLHLKSCTKILSQDGSRLLPLVPDSQTL